MKHYNILVFPGGSEIGLEIHRALRYCKDITLFSAAMDIPNHAPYVFHRHFILPSIHEPNWIEELNKIVLENNIDFIYPSYDDVIIALARNAAKIQTRLVLPPLETCVITRSKAATYRHFEGIIPVPKMYPKSFPLSEFPVFIKPDKGQGSQKTFLASDRQELEFALYMDNSALVLEYLPGDEVTVDCFSDRERGILFCGGRRRLRTKSGISMASKPAKDSAFMEFASSIHKHLDIYGAWFFQLKQDRSGKYKLLEIAPRIAGTMALHRVMGINFALLSIYEHDRIPISILANKGEVEIERALTNRYHHSYTFKVVYIDLDDTLILDGRVNTEIVRFLFQCLNQRIPVKLITKHDGKIDNTLKQYRLHGLFDEVVHLKQADDKAAYIVESDAILIDDSFSERSNLHKKRGVRTFDSSMIELLLNERI